MHKDVLKLLSPIRLAGDYEADIDIEGTHLDAAQTRIEDLLKEFFPDTALESVPDWERVLALFPGAEEPLQVRRDRIIQKLRERGALDRQYFIDLALNLGFTITIDELQPLMAGMGRCGDTLYVEGARFVWRVNVTGQAVYQFRAGVSAAGERLMWWEPQAALEELLNDLKPAHTCVIFNYS